MLKIECSEKLAKIADAMEGAFETLKGHSLFPEILNIGKTKNTNKKNSVCVFFLCS